MTRRILYCFFLLILLSGLIGGAPGNTKALAAQPTALVYVPLDSTQALEAFEATGLPAYARIDGKGTADRSYLLAGADRAGQQALSAAGLEYRILDPDMQGATYYIASQHAGREKLPWSGFGLLLLDQGKRVLLRTTPAQAEQLSRLGAELQSITLDPKPLHPAQGEAAIPEALLPDPLVQVMIDQVTTDQIYIYDRQLAGELPVWVDGGWYTIPTRYTYSGEPIQKTTHWVGQHMADLGLDVEYHVWDDSTNPNVIGEIPGLINPDDIFIIGAHLDAVQGAPGADDNGSGSVATLLAADILSQYQWGCTLRFALWTGEEQGLLGSSVYAQRAYQMGENIVGYLNLDMIAWNTIGSDPAINLFYTPSIPPTLALAQLFADAVSAYNLNLHPLLGTGVYGSDHASFWDYGFNAILGIEDDLGGDFNPYYHSPGDTPAHTDPEYFTNFTKASLATFVHLNNCLIPSGIGHLEGTVSDANTSQPIEGAKVTAMDDLGYSFPAYTDASGYFTRTLLAGTYTATAWAYSYMTQTLTDVQIITDTVTPVVFNLEPAPTYTISGTVTEDGTGAPLAADIEFIGSPVSVSTDPSTGAYQATLPLGHYTMKVRSDMHLSQERDIIADHDQTQDFALTLLPCNLLVDDDMNGPDVRTYYTEALDQLGYGYNVWDTSTEGDPAAADLEGYSHVLWFTGYPYSNVFTSANEAAVAAYLDGGGHFLLSSQDYLYESGLTAFGQNYLHIASFQSDVSQTSVTGQNVFAGLGPYTLSYPFNNYSDRVTPDALALLAFNGNQGDAAVSYDGDGFKTVFLGFPFEAISSLNDRADVLETAIDFFGGCAACQPVSIDSLTSNSPVMHDETMVFTSEVTGTAPINYVWDFGGNGTSDLTDPANPTFLYDDYGAFTVTLEAHNACSSAVDSIGVQVEPLAPVIDVTPLAYDITVQRTAVVTEMLVIGNLGDLDLDWTLGEAPDVGWLSSDMLSGTVPGGGGTGMFLTFDSAALAVGVYTTTLEVASNDPVTPLVEVPVTLTVNPLQPVIEVTPLAFDITLERGGSEEVVLTFDSAGLLDGVYSITGKAAGSYSYRVRGTNSYDAGAWSNQQSTTVAGGTNVVQNGDFENGSDGSWTEYSSNGFFLIYSQGEGVSVPPHGGTWAAWLGGANNELSTLSQLVTIPSGSPSLTYWYYIGSAETVCGNDIGRVDIGSNLIDSFTLCTSSNTYGWLERTLNLSAYAGQSLTLQFYVQTNASLNSNFFLDDVYLENDSVVTDVLNISNLGDLDLDWELAEVPSVGWLSSDQVSGTVPGGGSEEAVLTFDSTGLLAGVYTTTLEVASNDPLSPLVGVPVTLEVTTVCEPVSGVDFTWQPITPTVGEAVTFTATASGTEPITFTWQVTGPGVNLQSMILAQDVMTYTFLEAGVYTVTLTASNACGEAQISYQITVLPTQPPSLWVYLPFVSKH